MAGPAIQLPDPRLAGEVSVEAVLHRRRSVRHYRSAPLELADISQLLWAAQGVTHPQGYRTAPSAGAIFPLVLYVLAGRVDGLEAGCYRYVTDGHRLACVIGADMREAVFESALRQRAIRKAPAVVLVAAAFEAMTSRYGRRGHQYVWMEAGHAAQNLCLQAVAMGLGSVAIGAFEDDRLAECLAIPKTERPLYLLPVGRE